MSTQREKARSNLKMIGVMLDPARLTFQHQWYERWLADFAKWGYNTLLLNLADDTGCALELRRRPDLTSRHAFSQDEMSRLTRRASQYGIEIIPLIASLGHTGYIFWRKKYRHLGDGLKEPGRNVICPSHPESRQILTDVLEEVMELFPTQWMHVGLDETGELPKKTCARCRKHFRDVEGWEIFVQHLQWLHQLLSSHGKRMMMWGDSPLHHPQVADGLPKDIVMFDWHYEEEVSPKSVRFLLKRGFQVVGVPALTCWPDTTVLPHGENLANQRSFARIAHGTKHPGIVGLVNSVWVHSYNPFGATAYGMAYAADQFQHPGGSKGFGARFCRHHFGAKSGSRMAKLLWELHQHAPRYTKSKHLTCSNREEASQVTADDIAYGLELARHAGRIAAGLRRERPQVKRNRRVFDAYILAADIAEDIGLRGQLLAQASRDLEEARVAAKEGATGRARKLHRRIARSLGQAARRARQITDRALKNWDWGFYSDHPGRRPTTPPEGDNIDIDKYYYYNYGSKNIFYTFQRSTAYLEKLARQAREIIQGSRRSLSLKMPR